MDPMLLLIGLSLAGATSLGIIYGYQRATALDRVTRSRVAPQRSGGLTVRSALRVDRRSAFPLVDRLPVSASARDRMEYELERAGVPLKVGEYLGLRLGMGVAAAFVAALLVAPLGLPSITVIVGAGAYVLGWLAPRWWVGRRRRKRVEAIDAQMADALTTLAKSLRAGTGLLQALAYTAEQTPDPLGPELETTLRALRLGEEAEEAFARLSERVGSADLDIAVTAIIIQRTVGGNLSEILTNVAHTIRERANLYREINVITSRQRLTGKLMAAVPVLIALAFIGLNPDIGRLLIDTTPGRIALGVGIAFELAGLFLIQKFAKVEV
ncbi:MAG: type II secretion system F family protein [Dehalococcoidia bacterium]